MNLTTTSPHKSQIYIKTSRKLHQLIYIWKSSISKTYTLQKLYNVTYLKINTRKALISTSIRKVINCAGIIRKKIKSIFFIALSPIVIFPQTDCKMGSLLPHTHKWQYACAFLLGWQMLVSRFEKPEYCRKNVFTYDVSLAKLEKLDQLVNWCNQPQLINFLAKVSVDKVSLVRLLSGLQLCTT